MRNILRQTTGNLHTENWTEPVTHSTQLQQIQYTGLWHLNLSSTGTESDMLLGIIKNLRAFINELLLHGKQATPAPQGRALLSTSVPCLLLVFALAWGYALTTAQYSRLHLA